MILDLYYRFTDLSRQLLRLCYKRSGEGLRRCQQHSESTREFMSASTYANTESAAAALTALDQRTKLFLQHDGISLPMIHERNTKMFM